MHTALMLLAWHILNENGTIQLWYVILRKQVISKYLMTFLNYGNNANSFVTSPFFTAFVTESRQCLTLISVQNGIRYSRKYAAHFHGVRGLYTSDWHVCIYWTPPFDWHVCIYWTPPFELHESCNWKWEVGMMLNNNFRKHTMRVVAHSTWGHLV